MTKFIISGNEIQLSNDVCNNSEYLKKLVLFKNTGEIGVKQIKGAISIDDDFETFKKIIEVCDNNLSLQTAVEKATNENYVDMLDFYVIKFDNVVKKLLSNFDNTMPIFKNYLENKLISLGFDISALNSVLKEYNCIISGSIVLKSLLCEEQNDNESSFDIFVNIDDYHKVNMNLYKENPDIASIVNDTPTIKQNKDNWYFTFEWWGQPVYQDYWSGLY